MRYAMVGCDSSRSQGKTFLISIKTRLNLCDGDHRSEHLSGVILKRLFEKLIGLTILLRLHSVATLLVSVVVSILDKRPTLVRWDGEDWEFRWRGGCLYWNSHRLRPRALVDRNLHSYLAFYRPKIGDTVLDVGAGVGTEVCSFSDMVGPTGRVIAIEADPTAVRRLRKQAARLRAGNVTVLGVAAGAHSGTIQLHVDQWGAVGNSTAAAVGQFSVGVECRRLDGILADLDIEAVDYMKMNIEGAEYDALVGLGSSLGKVRETCISCHDFTGDPNQATYGKVTRYLASAKLELMVGAPESGAPWTNYYVFARQGLTPDSGGSR